MIFVVRKSPGSVVFVAQVWQIRMKTATFPSALASPFYQRKRLLEMVTVLTLTNIDPPDRLGRFLLSEEALVRSSLQSKCGKFSILNCCVGDRNPVRS